MARSGMADIITELRSMTDAGTADYTVGTLGYWTDDQLQNALDLHRIDLDGVDLHYNPRYESGTLVYKEYIVGFQWIESGTVTYLQDGDRNTVATAEYSIDYLRGIVTFTTDQAGSAYYLTGRTYDLNAAASDVWYRKAAHAAAAVNFSTDNHRVDRGMLIQNATRMAELYGQRAGGLRGSLMYERGDTWG